MPRSSEPRAFETLRRSASNTPIDAWVRRIELHQGLRPEVKAFAYYVANQARARGNPLRIDLATASIATGFDGATPDGRRLIHALLATLYRGGWLRIDNVASDLSAKKGGVVVIELCVAGPA